MYRGAGTCPPAVGSPRKQFTGRSSGSSPSRPGADRGEVGLSVLLVGDLVHDPLVLRDGEARGGAGAAPPPGLMPRSSAFRSWQPPSRAFGLGIPEQHHRAVARLEDR